MYEQYEECHTYIQYRRPQATLTIFLETCDKEDSMIGAKDVDNFRHSDIQPSCSAFCVQKIGGLATYLVEP